MANHPRSPLSVRVTARLTSAYQTQGPGNRLALTSSGVVAAPFRQTEWPTPQRKPFAVSLRTHIDGHRLNLYGKDQFFGAPGMGPDYDFPNPQRRRAQQPDGPQRSLALTAVQAASPFFGSTGPNPTVRAFSRWQHDARGTQLPAIFATPAIQVSTALPLRRPPAHVGFVQPTFGPLFPTGPKPFAQTDWPNPLRARQAYTGPWGLWAEVIPPPPEPICVHEMTAEPLSALTLTAGAIDAASLTASPLTGTTLTAEPPC